MELLSAVSASGGVYEMLVAYLTYSNFYSIKNKQNYPRAWLVWVLEEYYSEIWWRLRGSWSQSLKQMLPRYLPCLLFSKLNKCSS